MVKDANHVFFRCPLARFAWSTVRTAVGVPWDPRSTSDVVAILDLVQGSSKRVRWSYVGALFWALWLTRNKLAIVGIFRTHPANVIYKCNLFLQQWSPLARRKDTERMKHAKVYLRRGNMVAREPAATS